MAEHCNLYDRARYYDVIFDRDVSKEIQFFLSTYKKLNQRDATGAIDIACGPGYHAMGFAAAGLRSYGLDLRGEMLRFGDQKAKGRSLKVDWLESDMRNFRLEKPVDIAVCMFDSLDCLISNDDLIAHFANMGNNLTPGGLYVIDLSHPVEVTFGHYKKFHYSGKREGVEVDIYWATNDPVYDLATGIAHVELEMHVNDHGEKIVVKDAAHERLMFPQEINLMVQMAGSMDLVGWYGDFAENQKLDFSDKSRRMIGLFQRKAK